MILRDYQIKAREQLSASLAKHHSAILCMPTGSGKTVVFCDIANRVIQNGLRVMVLCDRKELIAQAHEKLNKYGIHPTIIAPGYQQLKNFAYLASVDTLKRRTLPDIDVLIVDEAHKQTFDNTVIAYREKCPGLWVIGATASPIRTGKQRSLHEIYFDIIEPVSITELIGGGSLVPAVTYGPKIDISELNGSGNEYSESKLFQFYNKQIRYDNVLENYNKFCRDTGPTLIFNVNREHSRKVVQALQDAGVRAEHIDGSFGKFQRTRTLNRFYKGNIDVLSNCSILTTGYDNPRITNLMVNRATKSLALWMQMCGRGSRPDDGKQEFNIIDMGSNVYQHGFWEDEREFNLVKKPKNKEGVAPVKTCPQCEAMVRASAKDCPHCNYIFPVKEKEYVTAEFKQVTSLDIPDHLRKPYSQMNESELREFEQVKGYKRGWAEIQIKRKRYFNRRSKIM